MLQVFLDGLVDVITGDLFISALGGALGGGVIAGIVSWVQTSYVMSKERSAARDEREAIREEDALNNLLSAIKDVRSNIKYYRHPFHDTRAIQATDLVDTRIDYGFEVCLPRIVDTPVRERFLNLKDLVAEYRDVRFEHVEDSYGNYRYKHPEHQDRMAEDIRSWVDYLRQTIEARFTHTSPPPKAVVLPLMKDEAASPWSAPPQEVANARDARRAPVRATLSGIMAVTLGGLAVWTFTLGGWWIAAGIACALITLFGLVGFAEGLRRKPCRD